MTAIVPLRGTALYIKVEDDASPATFAHPCLINAKRGIKFTSQGNKIIVPDCDNPDDPAWTQVVKDALAAAIDGAGVLDNKFATISFYDAWFRDKTSKRVRVCLSTVGYWSGDFHLTGWEITGNRGQNAEANVAMESHGALDAFLAGTG